MTPQRHRERHRVRRVSWLRAAVLGANDGIVSTASLLVGVAAADASHGTLLTAGIAGAVAGAMSMAAGEYVSVSSQADSEKADLARERTELATDDAGERRELMGIYMGRGLSQELAQRVADELMAHDALGAHARDELGITDLSVARPLQAACASALSFACGALLPLAVAAATSVSTALWAVPTTALFFLALLGALAARTGGAAIGTAAARVTFWGALAMAATAGIGELFGSVVQ
ncbi:MAG TPA: VIT family protein [Gammaproteobacteria bacterium]|nr:VIT family protein [Gammaproteobacteria bacterium]